MDHKIRIILSNILLLGCFAFLAMSSASTSQERDDNLNTIQKGWDVGKHIYDDLHSNNVSPREGSLDSIATSSTNDMAIK